MASSVNAVVDGAEVVSPAGVRRVVAHHSWHHPSQPEPARSKPPFQVVTRPAVWVQPVIGSVLFRLLAVSPDCRLCPSDQDQWSLSKLPSSHTRPGTDGQRTGFIDTINDAISIIVNINEFRDAVAIRIRQRLSTSANRQRQTVVNGLACGQCLAALDERRRCGIWIADDCERGSGRSGPHTFCHRDHGGLGHQC